MLKAERQHTDWMSVIDRARQLNPDAFDVLVDEFEPRVRGFLRRIVRTNDVDDLVQDVFLRVVRTIGRYEDLGRFDAWIFQIARNAAHDHLRDRSRRSQTAGFGEDRLAQAPAPRSTIGDQMEQVESAAGIEEALGKLPDSEREVILLRHFGRLTFEEIAEIMDTPIGTALARSHRGLSKLRKWMEEPA